MAEIVAIVLSLSPPEAKAVYEALGDRAPSKYSSPAVADAGLDVHTVLTPSVDEGGD